MQAIQIAGVFVCDYFPFYFAMDDELVTKYLVHQGTLRCSDKGK